MWAMIVKEFRQMRRDRRTLAMMIVLPLLLLVIFGYAASFDVKKIPTTVVGPGAQEVAARLPAPFEAVSVEQAWSKADAVTALRNGATPVAFVTAPGSVTVLLDGSELFTATAARGALAQLAQQAPAGIQVHTEVLFNPSLATSAVMVPGIAGMILLFVGTIITSLGVVRERQAGTLEQLAVMPLRPRDVFIGKIAPYFAVGTIDLAVVILVGVWLFDVPFNGSPWLLALGAALFLFVTMSIGVLISSVSETSGQAIQLAIMTLLPQVLISGLIFPLSSMPIGVRWIAYLLPLTYFTRISRGVMIRGADFAALWPSFLYLALLGLVAGTVATLRFRSYLAPGGETEVAE